MKNRNSLCTRAVVASLMFAVTTFAFCLSVGWAQSVTSIRQVDFLNFSYTHSCDDQPTRVNNGSFFSDTPDERLSLDINDIEYGDLTGDGNDEAVVLTTCSTGGTGRFSEGFIYTLRNGTPVRLAAEVEGGDRAFGAILRVKIANRRLEVVRNDGGNTGACCPQFFATTRFRLSNDRLVRVGQPVRRRIGNDDPSRERIRFATGRTQATLRGSTVRSDRYVIGARTGQSLILNLSLERGSARIQVLDSNGQNLAGTATNTSFSGNLPRNGDYEIVVETTSGIANYVLEVTIPVQR